MRGLTHRQDWNLCEEYRTAILKQLVHILDPESESGAKASTRTKIAAAKTIAALMKLDLGQKALDLAREKFDGKGKDQLTLADAVADAERLAQERLDERAKE